MSTDGQVEHGQGLDVQERTVKVWAKAHGHRLVAVLREEGVSGAKELEHRPALASALHSLRHREAEALVVPRLDRLARDLVLQEHLLAEVRRIGADVFSTSEAEQGFLADDPHDPSRKLIRQILGAVSEYERSMIALRLRAGRERKAAAGGYAFGAPPFGMTAEGRELVISPSEAQTLSRIGELRRDGRSLREIAVVLDAEGHRAKRGNRWHPEALRRTIARVGL